MDEEKVRSWKDWLNQWTTPESEMVLDVIVLKDNTDWITLVHITFIGFSHQWFLVSVGGNQVTTCLFSILADFKITVVWMVSIFWTSSFLNLWKAPQKYANNNNNNNNNNNIGGRVETIQETALLKAARILRRVWRLEETCCHSIFSERPSAYADVKNYNDNNNMQKPESVQ